MPYQFSKGCWWRLFGVPMTEEGIDLEALEQTIRQHRASKWLWLILPFKIRLGQ